MAENSHISWTDATFNPLEGCEKVSAGCQNCYAEARDKRFHNGAHWGPESPRLEHTEAYWRQPFKWNQRGICRECGFAEVIGSDDCRNCGKNFQWKRARVFCASLSDWLEDHPAWLKARLRLLDVIRQTPNLEWLLLTKRIENFQRLIEASARTVSGDDDSQDDLLMWLGNWFGVAPPQNVRIGVTAESQAMAQKRIPHLLRVPAQNFISIEPLLEPLDLRKIVALDGDGPDKNLYWIGQDAGIHEVIVGGESGPDARPMALEWAIDLREQCRAARVPFHFKQMGARPTLGGKPYPISDDKGGIWEEFPPELQVRELPEVEQ